MICPTFVLVFLFQVVLRHYKILKFLLKQRNCLDLMLWVQLLEHLLSTKENEE